jgi:hypothetical protein
MTGSRLVELADLLAHGATADTAAARLGLPVDLVTAMVDELERIGVVAHSEPVAACSSCAPSVLCAGCPVATSGAGSRVGRRGTALHLGLRPSRKS